ncbi:MAG TPA: inorganic diphosphatase [Vicinamibacterales bacterium]|nr:inorganic diphosphatase [Vicinamibacterales bacterium]
MLRVLLSLFLLSASASSSAAQTHFHRIHLNSTDPRAAIEFYTTHLSAENAIFDGADAVWTQASWLLFNKVKQPPASEVVSPLFHIGWGSEDMKAEFERDDPVSAAAWYEKHLGLTPRNQLKTERAFRGIPTGPSASSQLDNVTFFWYPTAHAKALFGGQWKGRTQYATNRGRATDHVAISVGNLDQTLARLREQGVKVLTPPRRANGMRSAFVQAPDNMELEIVEGHPRQTASATAASQLSREISPELPAFAATRLSTSLSESKPHAKHVWRDTPPLNEDGTVNGYIEIARGDRNKWEFDMARNARAIDRVIPENIGGFPVNYGFVPQTVSYDGDPFDILVLGPSIEGGSLIRGAIVGLLLMNDEKGYDAKVIVSPLKKGRPEYALTARVRQEIADYFKRYKLWERDKFSEVPGWGTGGEGLSLIQMTHAFFLECRQVSTTSCRIGR